MKPVGVKIIVNPDTVAKLFPENLTELSVTTVNETMKLHAAIGNGKGITVCYQSYYCKLCFENGEFSTSCGGWNFHPLYFPSHHTKKDNDNDNDIIPVQCKTHPEFEAGNSLVCVYDADKKITLAKFKKLIMIMIMMMKC